MLPENRPRDVRIPEAFRCTSRGARSRGGNRPAARVDGHAHTDAVTGGSATCVPRAAGDDARVKPARRPDPHVAAIAAAFARLEQGLQDLALELAQQEIDRLRLAEPAAPAPRRAATRRSRRTAMPVSSPRSAPPAQAPAAAPDEPATLPTATVPRRGAPAAPAPQGSQVPAATEPPDPIEAALPPPGNQVTAGRPPPGGQAATAGDPAADEHRRRLREERAMRHHERQQRARRRRRAAEDMALRQDLGHQGSRIRD